MLCRFDSINAKQYGVQPHVVEWAREEELAHAAKLEDGPHSPRPWLADMPPAPVTPDPRWGGGNSRADSDESSEFGYAAGGGSARRRVAMNLAAAHPDEFGVGGGPLAWRGSNVSEGSWGTGVAGHEGSSCHRPLDEIVEDAGDYDEGGSNMYHVAGGGMAGGGGVLGGEGRGGGMAAGQAGLDTDTGSGYGSSMPWGGSGAEPLPEVGMEGSERLLPLPTLPLRTQPRPASLPAPHSPVPAPGLTAPKPASSPTRGQDLLHAAAAGLAPATRKDSSSPALGADDPSAPEQRPPRTTSIRARARSVHVKPGQLRSGSPPIVSLSPRPSSPHYGGGGGNSARSGTSSPRSPGAAAEAARWELELLQEPMDTEALEADLAAVLRRLPASTRYGSRDGASELVAAGVVQQLYARVTRLQVLSARGRKKERNIAQAEHHSLQK